MGHVGFMPLYPKPVTFIGFVFSAFLQYLFSSDIFTGYGSECADFVVKRTDFATMLLPLFIHNSLK